MSNPQIAAAALYFRRVQCKLSALARTKKAHAAFLAVYTMKPEDLASFRSLPKPSRTRSMPPGYHSGRRGRTEMKAVNPFCGYVVVEAETVEAAARLFQDHPHITVFPRDGLDIMPFLT
jgi:transcription antitermination factor NusG